MHHFTYDELRKMVDGAGFEQAREKSRKLPAIAYSHVQVAKAFHLFTDKLCECGLRCESAWLISVFSAIHLHT